MVLALTELRNRLCLYAIPVSAQVIFRDDDSSQLTRLDCTLHSEITQGAFWIDIWSQLMLTWTEPTRVFIPLLGLRLWVEAIYLCHCGLMPIGRSVPPELISSIPSSYLSGWNVLKRDRCFPATNPRSWRFVRVHCSRLLYYHLPRWNKLNHIGRTNWRLDGFHQIAKNTHPWVGG